jgi:non-homologous end joining protein Ku
MKNPRATKTQKQMAKLIAMVIRNEMEDFQVEHLDDSQMRKLNPIIRNAICDALHMMANADDPAVAPTLAFNLRCIPGYWEEPALSDEYVRAIKTKSAKR